MHKERQKESVTKSSDAATDRFIPPARLVTKAEAWRQLPMGLVIWTLHVPTPSRLPTF
jgi:hypothetical protein